MKSDLKYTKKITKLGFILYLLFFAANDVPGDAKAALKLFRNLAISRLVRKRSAETTGDNLYWTGNRPQRSGAATPDFNALWKTRVQRSDSARAPEFDALWKTRVG